MRHDIREARIGEAQAQANMQAAAVAAVAVAVTAEGAVAAGWQQHTSLPWRITSSARSLLSRSMVLGSCTPHRR